MTKHLHIILSLFILSSFLTSCEKKEQINITLPDGLKYVGEGKDDLINGQGTFPFYEGAKYAGEFKDGIVWNGEVYNRNFKYKIVNGK